MYSIRPKQNMLKEEIPSQLWEKFFDWNNILKSTSKSNIIHILEHSKIIETNFFPKESVNFK